MDYTTRIDWILPITFVAIANAAEVWILVSLIHYGLQTKKWKNQNQGCVDKLNSRNQYTTLVACAVFCVIYSLLSLVYISVGFHVDEDKLCDSLIDVISLFYGLILVTVYIFLWLRQRTFYTNQMLNVTYSKTAKVFSAISIVIFLSAGTVVTVFLVYPNNHFSSLNGCVETQSDAELVAYFFFGCLLVFGQTTLLGLFFYALTKTGNQETFIFAGLLKDFCCCCYKQNINKTTQTPENNNQNSAESLAKAVSNPAIITVSRAITHEGAQHSCFFKSSKSAQNIRKVMHKTLLLAIISVVADLFFLFLVPNISSQNFDHMRFVMLATNLNALLSLLLLVFSFTVYREMLLSPCSWIA